MSSITSTSITFFPDPTSHGALFSIADMLDPNDQTQNWPEGDAHLSLMSLIDPSASNRAKWGACGRDIMVYMMNALLNNANEPIDGNNPKYWPRNHLYHITHHPSSPHLLTGITQKLQEVLAQPASSKLHHKAIWMFDHLHQSKNKSHLRRSPLYKPISQKL